MKGDGDQAVNVPIIMTPGAGGLYDQLAALQRALDAQTSEVQRLRAALGNAAWVALGSSCHTPLQDPDGLGKTWNRATYEAAAAVAHFAAKTLAKDEPHK